MPLAVTLPSRRPWGLQGAIEVVREVPTFHQFRFRILKSCPEPLAEPTRGSGPAVVTGIRLLRRMIIHEGPPVWSGEYIVNQLCILIEKAGIIARRAGAPHRGGPLSDQLTLVIN